jgi:2-desacetyl-2-hydroxyethyl bacteriochlorophyllide A dehydrogenase
MTSLITNYYSLIGPKQLFMEEVPIELPSADEYVAKTLFSAISPGTETAAYAGLEPLRPGKVYPRIQGYCNLAEVIFTGDQVEHLNVGDLIITFQSHRNLFKQHKNDFAVIVPQNLDIKQAATAYLFHLGLHALQTANMQAGHQVAVIGMGTLGITTALMCQLANAEPFIFSNQQKTEQFNDSRIKFYPKQLLSDKEILSMTHQVGFDIVINTSNKWDDWKLGLHLVRKGGTIVNLGFPGRGEPLPNFNPLDPTYVYFKNIQIKPLQFINESEVSPFEFRFNLKRNMEYILANMLSGNLNASVIISDCIPYTELAVQYENYLKKDRLLFTTLLDWNNSN